MHAWACWKRAVDPGADCGRAQTGALRFLGMQAGLLVACAMVHASAKRLRDAAATCHEGHLLLNEAPSCTNHLL